MASIAKRHDGRWRARYRAPDGRERSKHFEKKADADKWLAATVTDVERGSWVDPKRQRVTVGDVATQWLAGQAHLKPSTRANYALLLRRQVLPRWGTTPVGKVTHAEVAAWVSEMSATLSASRTRQAYRVLSAILSLAVRDSRLAVNPAAEVKLPRMPLPPRRYLTHAEVATLSNEAGQYRALILLLAYCGLRWGEAAALRVRHVDPLRGRIEVVEAVTEVGDQLHYGPPKTHAVRSVPAPRFLRPLLADAMAGKSRDDLLFTSPHGQPLRRRNFRRRVFDPAVRAAGLEELSPHALRHTCASLMIASGATVKAVQEALGHATATMTLDRYGHLFADELDALADRMDRAASAGADFLRTSPVADLPRAIGDGDR